MYIKLPESARERKRSFGGTAASTLLHMSLIGGAVVGTRGVATQVLPVKPDTVSLVYHLPPDPPDQVSHSHRLYMPPIPTDVIVPDVPALMDLTSVSDKLPPLASVIGSIPIEAFRRMAPDNTPSLISGEPSDEVYIERAVDKAVIPLRSSPSPSYPRMLASAGFEGSVVARFVVDTTGRIEPESITILQQNHALFENAVRDAMRRMRFSPADAGGRKVRQLVEQSFSFAIRK